MSDTTLPTGWYVSREHEMLGPLADSELRQRVERGLVYPHDYVWREGQELWLQITEIPALKAAIRVSSPAGHEQMRVDARAEHVRRDEVKAARHKNVPPKVGLPKMPNWSAPGSPPRAERSPPASSSAPVSTAPTFPNANEAGAMAIGKLRELVKNPSQVALALVVAGIVFPPMIVPLWLAAWFVWTKLRK